MAPGSRPAPTSLLTHHRPSGHGKDCLTLATYKLPNAELDGNFGKCYWCHYIYHDNDEKRKANYAITHLQCNCIDVYSVLFRPGRFKVMKSAHMSCVNQADLVIKLWHH